MSPSDTRRHSELSTIEESPLPSVEEFQEGCEALGASLSQKNKQITDLKSQLEALRAQNGGNDQALKAELQEKNAEITDLKSQLEALRADREKKDEEYSKSLVRMESLVGKLRGQLQQKNNKSAELKDTLEQQHQALKAELQKKNAEITDLKSQLAALRAQNEVRGATVAYPTSIDAQVKRQVFDESFNKLKSNLREHDKETAALKAELQEKNAELATLKADREKKDERIRSLTGEILVKPNNINNEEALLEYLSDIKEIMPESSKTQGDGKPTIRLDLSCIQISVLRDYLKKPDHNNSLSNGTDNSLTDAALLKLDRAQLLHEVARKSGLEVSLTYVENKSYAKPLTVAPSAPNPVQPPSQSRMPLSGTRVVKTVPPSRTGVPLQYLGASGHQLLR